MKLATVAAVLAFAVAVGAGCREESATKTPSSEPTAALSITYLPAGTDSRRSETWALQCAPDQGTLPDPAAACAALADPKVLAPVDPDLVCAEIFGGPQQIEVVGLLRGETVRAKFTRRNGCEIEAYDRVAAALGVGAP
jgi:Subtilisin inhibitor-like